MADDETRNPSTLSSENAKTSRSDSSAPIAASAAHPPPSSSSPAPHERKEQEVHNEGSSSGDHHKGPRVGNVENVDSIPTAGGERLGDKHWGESKIVPDDPGKQPAGVADSSASAEVRDNTAKNTGGATGGPHGHGDGKDGEKEGLMDKVKDKLNIGKK